MLASFSSSPQSPGVQYEADKKLASKLAPTGSVTLSTSHCGSWLASDKDNPATRYSGKNKSPVVNRQGFCCYLQLLAYDHLLNAPSPAQHRQCIGRE